MIRLAVPLGCCPTEPRCLVCPPPSPPTPAALAARLSRARRDRPDEAVEVRFFGGAPPDDAHLDALDGAPFTARVRPDLLRRADLDRLVRRGLTALELDALTFDDLALKEAGRPYTGARVRDISRALAAAGLRVGGVLAPGLPRTDFATALRDADEAAALWRFVRLHPVLVLRGARLRDLNDTGRYTALTLDEAITVCRAALDVLEPAGVEVIRVGLQPRPDGFGHAVAGPSHSALRELIEGRRMLERMREALRPAPAGADVTISVHPADLGRAAGPRRAWIRELRAAGALAGLCLRADPSLARGDLTLAVRPPGTPEEP